MLEDLPATALPRLLRRTSISALIAGAVGFVIALLVAPPTGALGLVVGLGFAFANQRMLDRKSARVQLSGQENTKVIRRQLFSNTLFRLGLITVVAIGALLLSAPLGVGIVSGLVLYQIVLVMNVLRVITGQGGSPK